MSGRSGFRKSHHPLLGRFGVRRARRTPTHLLPNWRLSFVLPPACSFALAPGPVTGLIGVTVLDLGVVEVVGKNRAWVLSQAAGFVRHVCRQSAVRRLTGRLVRDAEPGPTLSGPLRGGEEKHCQIEIDDRWIVINGTAMRQAVFPAA